MYRVAYLLLGLNIFFTGSAYAGDVSLDVKPLSVTLLVKGHSRDNWISLVAETHRKNKIIAHVRIRNFESLAADLVAMIRAEINDGDDELIHIEGMTTDIEIKHLGLKYPISRTELKKVVIEGFQWNLEKMK